MLLGGNTKLIVESVMPDLLHIIPVGHNTVLDGVLQGEHTTLLLSLITSNHTQMLIERTKPQMQETEMSIEQ